jgi:Ras-related C3 botulinum toxin substrate 1
VLVATKTDLRQQLANAISTAKGQQLATEVRSLSYVECSARANINVKGVFDKALELLLSPADKGGNMAKADGGRGRRGGNCVVL